MKVLTSKLQKRAASARRTATRAAEARAARDAAVLEALGAGMTHSQIAKATGLTRGRINQLANPRPETGTQ